MSDKKKLTPEQLKQIQMLQQMMQQQKGAGASPGIPMQGGPSGMPGMPASPKKWTAKGAFMATLQKMGECVKFVDQFVHLVIKKDHSEKNDVVDNARAPILFGAFVTIFFVVFGFVWASTAPLDSAAHALGTVASSTSKKEINHPEGGIVRAIHVEIGDEVKAGDKLITLDDARTRAEYESALNNYRNLIAIESRLEADLNNYDEIDYPEFLMKDIGTKEVDKIIETQNNLFDTRHEIRNGKKDTFSKQIQQYEKKIEGFKIRKKSQEKTLNFLRNRFESAKKLGKKGYAKQETILEFETRVAEAEGNIAMTETEIINTEQEISKTQISLLNADSEFNNHIAEERKQTQREISGVYEKYLFLKDSLARTVITAPVDGVVNKLNFHTIGASIHGSQPILEISPTNDKLIVEAKIPPKNIDSVRVGLISKIRFTAFKSRTTPVVDGTVVSLSPDIVKEQPGQATDPSLAAGYYLARIEIDMDNFEEIATPRGLVLQPGMQADIQIVTGTRTLLGYLLDPIRDAMFKGFKEK